MNGEHRVAVWRRRLPHWEIDEGTYFVSLRTVETLPAETLALLAERAATVRRFDIKFANGTALRPTSLSANERYGSFSDARLLRSSAAIAVIRDSFRFLEAEDRCRLHALCVVTTHIHFAIRMLRANPLRELMGRFKSFTSKALNRLIARTGEVWQDEYFDSLICDQNELNARISYIEENVRLAQLSTEERLFVIDRTYKPPA